MAQAPPPTADRPSQRLRAPGPVADLVRASEIVRILVAHGFGFLLDRTALAALGVSAATPDERVRDLPLAERVRRVLEALGPTFVKLGQVLSTRADVVPEEFVAALKALQDRAPQVPFATVKRVIEEELGLPLEQVFASFTEEPLATASIAQVHRATLRRGEETVEVAVKVQRPGIRQTMRSDLSLLYWLGRLLEGTIEEVSAYSPTAIVEQFEQAVEEELDFVHERHNLERARKNFEPRPDLCVVPEPFADVSTPRILTMRFLDGVKITDVRDDARYDKAALKDRLVEAAFKQVFEDGFFHGDPHPGNVMVLADGRLGLIDHGLWGKITPEQQDILLHWLTAIALKSPSTLARLTLRVGKVPPDFDRVRYERDVRALMDKYVGVQLESLDTSSVIADSIEVIRRHRIQLPPDFAVLARATATLEGIVRFLYPDLDFQALILPYVQRLVWRRFDLSRAGPEAMSLFLGMQDFVNEVPSQINQLLLDLSSGRFRVGLQGEALEELALVGRLHSARTALSVLAGALVLAAAITIAPFQYEVFHVPVAPVLLLLASFGAFWALVMTFVFPKGFRKISVAKMMFWRRPDR
ncbi:MAG: AarF/ABC1/UbiB kinase family protein [Planctomycetes bacterium]|nr:AarF/ABC1/UbiB kinase family protein [Planctomycetota bacterium]